MEGRISRQLGQMQASIQQLSETQALLIQKADLQSTPSPKLSHTHLNPLPSRGRRTKLPGESSHASVEFHRGRKWKVQESSTHKESQSHTNTQANQATPHTPHSSAVPRSECPIPAVRPVPTEVIGCAVADHTGAAAHLVAHAPAHPQGCQCSEGSCKASARMSLEDSLQKLLDLKASGLLTEGEFRTALLLHAQINGGAGTVLRDAGLRGEEASEGV